MNKTLESVAEFHKTFGAPVLLQSEIPSGDRVKLRLALILEELSELAEASGAAEMFNDMMSEKVSGFVAGTEKKDKVEALDALCDLQVVLNGTTLEYGLQNNFDVAFDEVHSSNMSKACIDENEVGESVEKYKKLGVEVHPEKVNGKYIIYRSSDKKILKGVNYFSPDLEKYI